MNGCISNHQLIILPIRTCYRNDAVPSLIQKASCRVCNLSDILNLRAMLFLIYANFSSAFFVRSTFKDSKSVYYKSKSRIFSSAIKLVASGSPMLKGSSLLIE